MTVLSTALPVLPVPPVRPVQVPAEVVALEHAGAYLSLTLRAPDVAAGVEPGHFVALGVGAPAPAMGSPMLLRRSFSVYRAEPDLGTVQVVFAVQGAGTAWLAQRHPGDVVDTVGPLGRPFPVPAARGTAAVSCTLVGGGYGTAPLLALAERLTAGGARVDFVLGASSADRLLGVAEAQRLATSTTVTTDDGSAGTRGRVSDVLDDVLERRRTHVVYACGPMPMLAAVTAAATRHGALAYTAVEEAMACGIGVCMTCVLPVVGADGATRMTRACTEGPVFRGDRVRWADVGTVPADTVGAPGRTR